MGPQSPSTGSPSPSRALPLPEHPRRPPARAVVLAPDPCHQLVPTPDLARPQSDPPHPPPGKKLSLKDPHLASRRHPRWRRKGPCRRNPSRRVAGTAAILARRHERRRAVAPPRMPSRRGTSRTWIRWSRGKRKAEGARQDHERAGGRKRLIRRRGREEGSVRERSRKGRRVE